MSPPKMNSDETIKFVKLYKNQECLWRVDSQEYRNKQARDSAILKIREGMGIPNLYPEDIRSKIKYLRATFMIEVNKIKKSQKSGAGTADVYKPTLKWYDEMASFILYHPTNTETISNMSADGEESEPNVTNVSEDGRVVERTIERTTHQRPSKKRSRLSQLSSVVQEMKDLTKTLSTEEEEDEFEVFGKHVAFQLRKLSLEQALCAQEQIQSVLTRSRLNDIRHQSTSGQSSFPRQRQCTPPTDDTSSSMMLSDSSHYGNISYDTATNYTEPSTSETNIIQLAFQHL